MYKKLLLIVLPLLSLAAIATYGQDKKKQAPVQEKSAQKDNSFSPVEEGSAVVAPNKNSKKKKKSTRAQYEITMEQKVLEFEERMEANAKAYKKQQKEMQKPQYSDPSYFGHKRKPKIRKFSKRKFCKECGIVH